MFPFVWRGGTAIATGRGEKIDPIRDLDNLWVVLGKYNDLAISTPWAYRTYREQFGHQYVNEPDSIASRALRVHSGPLVKAIMQQQSLQIGQLLHNDLEESRLTAISSDPTITLGYGRSWWSGNNDVRLRANGFYPLSITNRSRSAAKKNTNDLN